MPLAVAECIARRFGDEQNAPTGRWRLAQNEGKVFVDYDERAAIAENLETAWVALDPAFHGIWVPKTLELGHVREYCDDSGHCCI